jgi:hypothetical protein
MIWEDRSLELIRAIQFHFVFRDEAEIEEFHRCGLTQKCTFLFIL